MSQAIDIRKFQLSYVIRLGRSGGLGISPGLEYATQVVDFLDLMFIIKCWSLVHCRCNRVERMNEAISWRDTRLIEVLMTKLECVRDRYCFRLGTNSSLAEIMVDRNTVDETIASSVIPEFDSAWFVVNDDRDPKGAKWSGTIIKRSGMQVFSC